MWKDHDITSVWTDQELFTKTDLTRKDKLFQDFWSGAGGQGDNDDIKNPIKLNVIRYWESDKVWKKKKNIQRGIWKAFDDTVYTSQTVIILARTYEYTISLF